MTLRLDADTQRAKQIQQDRHYIEIAKAMGLRGSCRRTRAGAVVVLGNRVVSTGFNGMPNGVANCDLGGCIRDYDKLGEPWRESEASDRTQLSHQALDDLFCVHAEQNAIRTAARFEIELDGATLYTRQNPCFACLKESVHVGISRIVYESWYGAKYSVVLRNLYIALYQHLTKGDPTNFEVVGGVRPAIESEGQPDVYAVDSDDAVALQPPPDF
jgi:deoxycytidylate deaminase